jgi:hypothetical protein
MGKIMLLLILASEANLNQNFITDQLLFLNETRVTRWMYNNKALVLQRRFFLANLPIVVLPIRVN